MAPATTDVIRAPHLLVAYSISSISRSPGAVSPASLSTACIYYDVSRSTSILQKSYMTLCNQVPSRTSNTASSSNDSKVAGRLTGARTLHR